MKLHSNTISLNTKKDEPRNLTNKVNEIVNESEINDGLCNVFVKHTTCFIILNENEANLLQDFLKKMYEIIPQSKNYFHDDGNAHAHLKEILLNSGKTIPISQGKLDLGTWQKILFFDPDGPRPREILVKLIGE